MMKKGFKLILSILMVISICSAFVFTASAADETGSYLGAEGYLITDATSANAVQPVFKDGRATLKINLSSGLTVTGAMVTVKYDKTVLKVVDAGPVTTKNSDGEDVEVVTGMHTHGVPKNNDSAYTFAYISANGYKTGNSGKEFAFITFEVINKNYPLTTIEVVAGDYTSISTIKSYTNVSILDAGIINSFVAGDKSVIINWNAVPGASEYAVYRKTSAEKSYRRIANVSGISYTDSENIENGEKYTYAIRAKNAYGSGWYVAKSFVYLDPMNITVINDTSGIKIAWDKVEGATGYKVFKRTQGVTEWTEVSSVGSDTLTVTDTDVTSGAIYEYTACAMKGDSASGLAEIQSVQYVGIVSKVALSNANGGVNIKWTEVAGAEKYRVYRKVKGETKWTLLDTVGANVTSYLDKGATTGVPNYYAIRALSNNTWSAYKSYGINYIATPQVTKAVSKINTGITLTWNEVSGAAKYRVYRASDDGKKWVLLGTVVGSSYTDKNVTLGKNYKYTLRAENGKNLSGYNSKGWVVTYTLTTPAISNVTASTSAVSLKWGAVKGADGYRVYRKTEGATKWTQLAKVTGTSYIDKNVTRGVVYNYTVRAYAGKILSGYNKTGWVGAILSTPTVKISNDAKGVKVAWSTVNGAQGYTVYRSQYDSATGKWTKWASRGTAKANKSSWVDTKTTSGINYKYTVRAIAGSCKSAYKASNAVLYLAQPTVKISNVSNGICVNWIQVNGATGYRVYRSQYNETTGAWTSWKNMGTAKANKSSWVDKSVVDGVTYKYTARTVNGKTLSSYTATSELMFLKTPALISCENTANGVVLTFEKNEKADSYRVYRKTNFTNWVLLATINDTVYTDNDVIKGTEYIYTVRSLNGNSVSYYNKTGVSVTVQ